MKPRQRRFLFKLIPYPVIATGSAWLYLVVEKGLIGETAVYPTTGAPYDAGASLVAVTIMSVFLGSLIGLIEELFFKNKLRKLPFFYKILSKTIIYVFIAVTLLLISSIYLNATILKTSVFDPVVLSNITSFFISFTFLSIIIFISVMIGACLFYAEIVDFLGTDVIGSFFTGKYAKSVIEDRIFMFLDMKGSTAIAEKLGHENHYRLINDYYADMTEPIVNTMGNIYQYVGDEIVIFWNTSDGLSKLNCINCFFQIKERIADRAEAYKEKYGLVPTFKAGLHLGKVTRGQVGRIKRELLFTGDVLNATARIQAMCNELETELLVSGELKEALPSDSYQFIDKGAFDLKGRNQKMSIFEVLQHTNHAS